MSNDKVAAAVHGTREDFPYRVQAYAIGHANGKGRKIPTVQDWMCAQQWGAEQVQPTGEHVWEKFAEDDLYQDFTPKRGWTPTPVELLVAVSIVLAIIVIFVFIVVAY